MSLFKEIQKNPKDIYTLIGLRIFPLWVKHHDYKNYFVRGIVSYVLFFLSLITFVATLFVSLLPSMILQVIELALDYTLTKITQWLTGDLYQAEKPKEEWPSFFELKKRRAAEAVFSMNYYASHDFHAAEQGLTSGKIFEKLDENPIIVEDRDKRRVGWSRVKAVFNALTGYISAPSKKSWGAIILNVIGRFIALVFFIPLLAITMLFEGLVRPILRLGMVLTGLVGVIIDTLPKLIFTGPLYLYEWFSKKPLEDSPVPYAMPKSYPLLMKRVAREAVSKDAYTAQVGDALAQREDPEEIMFRDFGELPPPPPLDDVGDAFAASPPHDQHVVHDAKPAVVGDKAMPKNDALQDPVVHRPVLENADSNGKNAVDQQEAPDSNDKRGVDQNPDSPRTF